VEGEKMSKSLGNFFTIHDLLKDWPGEVLRFQMLMTHYRQPIDWTKWVNEQASIALDSFQQCTKTAHLEHGHISQRFLDALSDDLNTPQAIVELHRLAGEARSGSYQAAADLRVSCKLLGLNLIDVGLQEILKRKHRDMDETAIHNLIEARAAARKAKNFAESDRIRDELAAMGVVLKDSKDGTTWEIAR
jgi:cysteinyl-tRNA synthetase